MYTHAYMCTYVHYALAVRTHVCPYVWISNTLSNSNWMQACANITKAQKHTNTHTHISVSKTDIYPYIRHPCLRTSRLQRSQGAIKAGSQFFRKSRSAAIMDIMSACFFARTRHTTESRSKSVWIKPQSLGTSGETPVLALPALPNPAIETPEVTGTGCHAEDSNLMTFSTEFPRVNSSSQFFGFTPRLIKVQAARRSPFLRLQATLLIIRRNECHRTHGKNYTEIRCRQIHSCCKA